MIRPSGTELLTEAAGVKIFRTSLSENDPNPPIDPALLGKVIITLENVRGKKTPTKTCGFHLTKSKWDPYPWVSYVETGSIADSAGLRSGDCLVKIDDTDLMGLKIKEIASLVQDREYQRDVQLSVWRNPEENEESQETGLALKGPLPDVASRLANAVSGAVRALECPVCLESSMPPVSQCVHGHIICVGCRARTARCPVCRVRLGQGRCLLADKLHRIFRDIFNVQDEPRENGQTEGCSLRDRLFGRIKKKRGCANAGKNNGAKPRQLLLARLLLGGLEKAASAENLTSVTETGKVSLSEREETRNPSKFDERLSLQDRTKSASTGELSREKDRINDLSFQTGATSSVVSSTNSLASSTLHTPTWGGSTDSVSCTQLTCPLARHGDCKDIVTPGTLLEHLKRTHEVPQIHFYSADVKIPLPLPFGVDAVYVLHYAGDLFFFQYEEEKAWMTCAMRGSNAWEWILRGWGKDGTEVKLRRNVASLEDPLVLLSQHVAPVPNALLVHTVNIQLLECRTQEKLDI